MSFPSNKKPVTSQKRRGGYYTPLALAQYLAEWGMRGGTQRVLEPSCGDGNFVAAILRSAEQRELAGPLTIVAVEIEEEELERAKGRVAPFTEGGLDFDVTWIRGDFFRVYRELMLTSRFDLVVGNPPFIRFQYFDDDSRAAAFRSLRSAGYKPTKLANAWAAFVQLSIELLDEGGRLAMVVPAELLQVNYARQLRDRLAHQFARVVIVGFKELVFPEIQQEVVLLLAEGRTWRGDQASDIYTVEFRDGEELLRARELESCISHGAAKHSRRGMKWTSLFLQESYFAALDEAERAAGLCRLGDLAEVDIGIVTGRNAFFVLTEAQRDTLGVSHLTAPIIGRTSALRSIVFDGEGFRHYSASHPCFLLDLTGVEFEAFPETLKAYIRRGEDANVHRGYKCRIRRRWFDVPSVYVPEAFLFRQIHDYPLLVVNEGKVTSTDTIHRVRVKPGVSSRRLAALSFNSLTLAWSEVCGRSYGGGVLELEPTEAEELPVPYSDAVEIDVEKVNALLSRGQAIEALDYVDEVALKSYIGLDTFIVEKVRSAWQQLRDRRSNRRRGT